jgi:hypothetical protein
MVSLRQWWSERWRALADWQRSLGGTLAGGVVLRYLLPFLRRVLGSLATFTQIALVGLLLVGVLFHSTRRRIDELEGKLDGRLQEVGEMQRTTLNKIDDIVTRMADASPDGGARVGGAHSDTIQRADSGRDSNGDAWGPLSVVFVGFVSGLLVAVGAGLGSVGSLPVTLAAMVGGLVAAAARELWTHNEERQPPAEPPSEGMGGAETACDAATLLEARSLASLLDGRDVEVGNGRVTFRSQDGRWNLHLEPDAGSGSDAMDRDP